MLCKLLFVGLLGSDLLLIGMLCVLLSVEMLSGLFSIEQFCKLLYNRLLYAEVLLGCWFHELLFIRLFNKSLSIGLVKILFNCSVNLFLIYHN